MLRDIRDKCLLDLLNELKIERVLVLIEESFVNASDYPGIHSGDGCLLQVNSRRQQCTIE